MFDDTRGAHHTIEESQGEAYRLAATLLIPMVKRVLFLEMEVAVVDGSQAVVAARGRDNGRRG